MYASSWSSISSHSLLKQINVKTNQTNTLAPTILGQENYDFSYKYKAWYQQRG